MVAQNNQYHRAKKIITQRRGTESITIPNESCGQGFSRLEVRSNSVHILARSSGWGRGQRVFILPPIFPRERRSRKWFGLVFQYSITFVAMAVAVIIVVQYTEHTGRQHKWIQPIPSRNEHSRHEFTPACWMSAGRILYLHGGAAIWAPPSQSRVQVA